MRRKPHLVNRLHAQRAATPMLAFLLPLADPERRSVGVAQRSIEILIGRLITDEAFRDALSNRFSTPLNSPKTASGPDWPVRDRS
jgi:hypothetical protein